MTIAEGLRQAGFSVEVSEYLERHATDEQKRAGLDLADFLLMPDVAPPAELPAPIPLTSIPSVADKKQTFYQWSKSNWGFRQLGLSNAG
jgi:hypothetical protein